ncbi:DUF2764 family protein [Croceimicrobium sp.]|uniref:DUF2764 family protein n=1 Tax=Croceimicrobium sp. TaxID=2828340 RepID=UPI003BABDF75
MTEYYYILSSMPDLDLEKRPSEEALEEAIDLILRQIQDEDRENLAWFFRRNDLYNLIEFWQFEYGHLLHRPLRKPYSLDQEKLKNLRLEPEVLPFFLQDWYRENQESMGHWSANRIETEVHKRFFDAIEALPPSFIRDYFLFEKEMRAFMATYHQSRYPFLDSDVQWLNREISQGLHKKPAQISPTLQLEKPWLEKLLKALDSKEPKTISLAVHQVLWAKADELSTAHYFDLTALLNYCAKLFLLYRREQLSENRKEARLQALVDEALQNLSQHD